MSAQKVYQKVTDEIIKRLETGVIPWHQAWKNNGVFPRNLNSDREYHGTNWLLLSSLGFASPFWATFQQIKTTGGHVKKGASSLPIIYADKMFVDESGKRVSPEVAKKRNDISVIPFVKYFSVFNLTQAEEIPLETVPQITAVDERPPIERAEEILLNFQLSPQAVTIHHGCSLSEKGRVRACYALERDEITVPDRALFDSMEEYYSTVFHEIIHSTGHSSRLARNIKSYNHIDEYALEELTAEIGSAYLCARCGIGPATIQNSTGYISTWLKRLKGDPNFIVKASAAAQRAADLVLGLM